MTTTQRCIYWEIRPAQVTNLYFKLKCCKLRQGVTFELFIYFWPLLDITVREWKVNKVGERKGDTINKDHERDSNFGWMKRSHAFRVVTLMLCLLILT